MRDIAAERKELRLHGMVSAWADLTEGSSDLTEQLQGIQSHLRVAFHCENPEGLRAKSAYRPLTATQSNSASRN
jgi:hypothetical protein